MQSEAVRGRDSPGTGSVNLSSKVGHGRNANLLKLYSGKMARSTRQHEGKLLISRGHSQATAGCDSPGPAQYMPKEFGHNSGFSFGTSERKSLAKVAF